MKTILILEDNDERIASFRHAVAGFGADYELKLWSDAPTMIEECEKYFSSAALMSLDHDLNPKPGVLRDAGTGLDVARFLGDFKAVCPVLIHSSNTDYVYSMQNELRFAQWIVDRVGPIGQHWIETSWSNRALQMLAEHGNTWKSELPVDHVSRVDRMRLSLDGLGIGDSLGEMLSSNAEAAPKLLASENLPPGPWLHTDDTEMAISISAVLKSHGFIDQDALAKRFARRFERDPERGYGRMARIQLREMMAGAKWPEVAPKAFGGQGSMGNGAAMRVAPLGAYFADDLVRCAEEAQRSAVITHTHPEGVAGAVAVAVAASTAWRLESSTSSEKAAELLDAVLQFTPESEVRRKIQIASKVPKDVEVDAVARSLGNGSLVTAPDTVPFTVWLAAHHLDNFVDALSKAIRVGGDCDTNSAIVGGITALSSGYRSIPRDWLERREPVRL